MNWRTELTCLQLLKMNLSILTPALVNYKFDKAIEKLRMLMGLSMDSE